MTIDVNCTLNSVVPALTRYWSHSISLSTTTFTSV